MKKAREEFDETIGEKGHMQLVYEGKETLTDEQVDKIFRRFIEDRLEDLRKIYDWDKLKANERLAIISLYFNNPTLVNKKTNFHKHITNYLATNDTKHLKLAVEEVETRPNGGG